MVDVYIKERVGNVVTLSTGVVIDIDSFSGNGWTQNRCGNIEENIQKNWLDEVIDRDALPAGDPDKTATAIELQATYGGWFVELDTQGNSNDIRLRRTEFFFFPVDADGVQVTSGNGVSFGFRFRSVAR